MLGELSAGGARVGQSDTCTPTKMNMEHNHGGLEDHFTFLNG